MLDVVKVARDVVIVRHLGKESYLSKTTVNSTNQVARIEPLPEVDAAIDGRSEVAQE